MPSRRRLSAHASRRRGGYTHVSSPPPRSSRTSSGVRGEQPWTLRLRSASRTRHLGFLIGQSVRGGETIALVGDLGTGKTTLVRGIAAGLEVPPRLVTSPTFVMVQEYQGRLPLIHADLYRLDSVNDVIQVGLSNYFADCKVAAVEWAEKGLSQLPADRLEVYLSHRSPSTREISLNPTGPKARSLLARTQAWYESGGPQVRLKRTGSKS